MTARPVSRRRRLRRHDRILLPALLASALLAGGAARAEGDAERGAQAFRFCAACHSTAPGEHRTGPSLAGVAGRPAGAAPAFRRYSDALDGSGLVWDEATLDAWLADPAALVPGNAMQVPGIAEPDRRADLIAFLQTLPATGGAASTGLPELKSAPPDSRVTAVRHCGDTYEVGFADGTIERFWEFNLRFKTDSSASGPAPDRPVLVGTGMMGDRAAIVFAAPAEISAAIAPGCAR